MKAEFSEFTYGFSLVNELAKALSCTAVPIFPSLSEEGKKGGGYDAKLLSKKGKILNLQFKLSDRMKARSAREYKIPGHSLSLPYYRFQITSERISEQHSLLLSLEDIEPLTFYAAPAFYQNDEINAHWSSDSVTRNSVFVKPSSIGDLPDFNPHKVCFDAASIAKEQAYFFSEPREIPILPFQSFSEFVIAEVVQETNTLESSISRAREQYASAIRNARRRERDRSLQPEIFDYLLPTETSDILRPVKIPSLWQLRDRLTRDLLRLEEILSEPADGRDLLRQVAQVSSGIFGAQAIAVVVGN